jgi:hypothetical protein
VLTADVRFEGWTATDWTRFLNLWKPRATPEQEAHRPRGGIIAIHDGARVRKLLHTMTGRVEPSHAHWPMPLAELAEEHHASWALVAHFGALEEVMEEDGDAASDLRGERQALRFPLFVRRALIRLGVS